MKREYLIALCIFILVSVVLFAMLTIFIAPSAARALLPVSGDLDAQTLAVAKGLYCPVCPGVPLDVCDTQACVQWRALIKQKLSEGASPSQIQDYFVQQYGERVLGAPRAQGLNVLVYALPALVVASGAAILYLFARRRLNRAPSEVPPTPIVNEYRSRIERELKENE